jgi:UDP-N-acetyl-D-glucosamine/UDP-N-acetyl-D-galactosamine dehydrogenase
MRPELKIAAPLQSAAHPLLDERIAVIGLGYVGLPVALAFAKVSRHVVGFDVSEERVADLAAGQDRTREATAADLSGTTAAFTTNAAGLAGCTFFVVTVPTPITDGNRPDFGPLLAACRTVGACLTPGAVVVFESTVYPGATEEICAPALEASSGLICGQDFHLGYSPERIDPGSQDHKLESIVKVVAGQTPDVLKRVAAAYRAIVPAGVHEAPTIRAAEAAKVIENTQRDLNIALMNELSLIFDRLGISTRDVLAAARTKWNFLPFTPGLVGGHCIGVDPYYLTAKAEAVGYHPQVILAGRRINDSMGAHVARRTLQLLSGCGVPLTEARIGVFGLTFKPNVPDLRNSKTLDVVAELRAFGCRPQLHDPYADPIEAAAIYGEALAEFVEFEMMHAVVLAVPHAKYLENVPNLLSRLRRGGVLIDVKGAIAPDELALHRRDLSCWSL